MTPPSTAEQERAARPVADLSDMLQNDSIQARFWAKVDKRGPDECWPWTGTISRAGRGEVCISGTRGAHRIALMLATGICPPSNLFACHTCDNGICCNPAHLWWGTQSENMQDCRRKGRFFGQMKTHCPRGHALSGDNVIWHRGTGRKCRICQNRANLRYRALPKAMCIIPKCRRLAPGYEPFCASHHEARTHLTKADPR